jgi:hypothetical protein
MKKVIGYGLLAALMVTSGCATTPELIKASNISSRSDVFQELTDGGAIPRGYADLRIVFSLKTHRPGLYSEKDPHGTAAYLLLVNVDGQVVRVGGMTAEESSEPRSLRDPESGEGIRYRFDKRVRLKAGTHKIAVALPEDDVAVAREVKLAAGSSNTLVLEPVYGATAMRIRPTAYTETSFSEGIKGLLAILNGRPL